jgi:catechol 2,3-dioxygenase-like lactoylglutathione lyase family enzyme
VFFRAGTSVLLIFNPDVTKVEKDLPPHFGNGKIHIAFEVNKEDYKSMREKTLSKGIKIIHEQNWPGGFQSFYFLDPDEHVLEVVERGMWEVKKKEERR